MMQYLLLTFAVTLAALVLILKTRLRKIALDEPNHRSMHTKITPRTGGLAILAGIFVGCISSGHIWLWVLPLLSLAAVSLLDDIRSLPVRWRLIAQFAVNAGFVLIVIPYTPLWQMMLMVLALTWMINLYNFMDGSDGLAGGMALFGFTSYALAAYLAQAEQLAFFCGSVAVASLAFLPFNYHPARIFMGDVGSVPLGFLVGAMGLYGCQQHIWPLWFPVLVFSPFIVDTTVTLVKRLLQGERIWQAHRNHYYQRLIQMGWGHSKTAIAEYLLMLSTGASAISLLDRSGSLVLLAIFTWVVIYAFLTWLIDYRWKKVMTGDFR